MEITSKRRTALGEPTPGDRSASRSPQLSARRLFFRPRMDPVCGLYGKYVPLWYVQFNLFIFIYFKHSSSFLVVALPVQWPVFLCSHGHVHVTLEEIWAFSFAVLCIILFRLSIHINPPPKPSFISTVRPTVHTNPPPKPSFISTVRPTVHTNPSRKPSFISTVRPTVHTNPSRKPSFISFYS